MFKKQFKIKSQVQLKSSEKKKLAHEVQSIFPRLSSEEISELTSNKVDIMKMKIVTFAEEIVDVYLIDKTPLFFEIPDLNCKLPTIYMCWKYPQIATTFTTNAVVLEKLKNGADLFLPGVYTDTEEYQSSDFKEKDPAAVNLITNSAACVVGRCLLAKQQVSGPDSSLLGGRLLKVYHTVGDYLCKYHPMPIPTMGPPVKAGERLKHDDEAEQEADSTENLIEALTDKATISDTKKTENGTENSPKNPETQLETPPSTDDPPSICEELSEKEKMDQLMLYCFIKSVKTAPKSTYPILPAAFYANHMLAAVPDGESLNIKKSKWKKLSGFLQDMAADKLVKLETIRPNEYRIVGVETSNPKVREFVDPHHKPITIEAAPSGVAATSVQEVFVVTATTQALFIETGLQKGDEITRLDVRTALTNYIRRKNLVLPETPDRVRLDDVLRGIFKNSNPPEWMTRVELLGAVLGAMPLKHKVSSGGDVIVHKANLPLVEFDVVTRSGNKKVTLISNLEGYGVDIAGFAKSLQHAAAASTTVTGPVPGKKGPQVQVQGNQVLVASRLLVQTCGIAEKYMRGLDKAPKSKRK